MWCQVRHPRFWMSLYSLPNWNKNFYRVKKVIMRSLELHWDRSKMYSCQIEEQTGKVSEKKRGKGIKKHIVEGQITHQDYVNCVQDINYNPAAHRAIMIGFQTRNQQIYTTSVTKNTLSPADDKLYQKDATHTLPYGHKIICVICNHVHEQSDECVNNEEYRYSLCPDLMDTIDTISSTTTTIPALSIASNHTSSLIGTKWIELNLCVDTVRKSLLRLCQMQRNSSIGTQPCILFDVENGFRSTRH